MPRITPSKEFSPEQLFSTMEAGFHLAAQIVSNDTVIDTLSEAIGTGSETIPYDMSGEFGLEMSDTATAALVRHHHLKEETAAMRKYLRSEEKKLLQVVFGAAVSVDAYYPEEFGENVWGVGYQFTLTTRGSFLRKDRLKEDVNGMVIDVDLWKSTLELENRQYSNNRLQRVEVPILDRFGRRCARFLPYPDGKKSGRISQRAIEKAAGKMQITKKALLA